MESTGSKRILLVTSDSWFYNRFHSNSVDARIVDTSIFARGSVLELPSMATGETEPRIVNFGITFSPSSRKI